MTDPATSIPTRLMGARAAGIVNRHQNSYLRAQPIRVDPSGRWVIFGHESATTCEVCERTDGLWEVLIGGERENPSLDFTTNDRHAVDVFVALELGLSWMADKTRRPQIQPGVILNVSEENRTQCLEWPGGWAEGPTRSSIPEARGHALPQMAHYITMNVDEILARNN